MTWRIGAALAVAVVCSSAVYAKSDIKEGSTENLIYFRDERGKSHITTTVSAGDEFKPFLLHRWHDINNDDLFNGKDYLETCFYFSPDVAVQEAGRKKLKDCTTTRASGVPQTSDFFDQAEAYRKASSECTRRARSASEYQIIFSVCRDNEIARLKEQAERERRWAEESAETTRDANPLVEDPVARAYTLALEDISLNSKK